MLRVFASKPLFAVTFKHSFDKLCRTFDDVSPVKNILLNKTMSSTICTLTLTTCVTVAATVSLTIIPVIIPVIIVWGFRFVYYRNRNRTRLDIKVNFIVCKTFTSDVCVAMSSTVYVPGFYRLETFSAALLLQLLPLCVKLYV